jgi:hypothetical protein
MTSILKVDTIQDTAGNNIINESSDTITIGASGDTITIPSGATISNLGTASGFGKVLQVVTATDSTQRDTTSVSFVTSTGLSLSITPSSAGNKIFLVSSHTGYNNTGGQITYYTLFRDSTNLGATNGFGIYRQGDTTDETCISMSHLDSPNSTSAITYAVYFKVSANTGSVNKGSLKGTLTAFEIQG